MVDSPGGQGATELKSSVEDDVRKMFRQGMYAEAVPLIQEHRENEPEDISSLELMADALRYSGDKAGAAAALSTAADLYSAAGMIVQSIAAQKRAMQLGVEPDFSRIRARADAGASTRMRTPLFDELEDDEFQVVAEVLEMQAHEEGDVIVREGESGDSMFIVAKGELVVSVQDGAVELARLGPGDFFGESALLSGRPRTATIHANGDCECLVLMRSGFDMLTARFPRVLEVMKQFNEERARSTIDTLTKVG